MTPAEKAYNDYKDSVDNKYAGGLIPEITNFVDELKQQNSGLIETLKDIKKYGYKNPGCGFSCAKFAEEHLNKIIIK